MKKTLLLLLIIMTAFLVGCSNDTEEEKLKIEIPIETQNIVKNYVKENLSNLSPEKEALGGKFYITQIDFSNPNIITINYEDGHIALKAKANFKIENENVEITNFELINEEDPLITNEYLKCNNHDDCVALPGCHPKECINKKYQKDYEQPDACTLMYDNCAAYADNDCICQQGTCFNENLMNQECSQ